MPNDNPVIPQWDQLPALPWKDKIAYLTYRFLQLPQTDCPVEHLFKGGWYYRTMRIPAGTLFLGRAHRVGHEVQLLEGSGELITEQGKLMIEAPYAVVTSPGHHIVFHAITDVVGRTVHPDTGERDIETLEKDIFEPVEILQQLGQAIHQRLTCQA